MTHPNRVFAARADLISFHPEFSTTVKGVEFVAGLLDDARALWAVRVLDAAGRARSRRAEYPRICVGGGFVIGDLPTLFADEDAARLAAAEAVFLTLDDATRAKLGPCP